MYDTERLIAIAKDIGFESESKNPFDSQIKEIRVIEQDDRCEDAIILESRK